MPAPGGGGCFDPKIYMKINSYYLEMAETEADAGGFAVAQPTSGNSKSSLIDSMINIVLKVLIVAYIVTWFIALT